MFVRLLGSAVLAELKAASRLWDPPGKLGRNLVYVVEGKESRGNSENDVRRGMLGQKRCDGGCRINLRKQSVTENLFFFGVDPFFGTIFLDFLGGGMIGAYLLCVYTYICVCVFKASDSNILGSGPSQREIMGGLQPSVILLKLWLMAGSNYSE